jgi:ferredoxin
VRGHGLPPASVDPASAVNVVFVDRAGEKKQILAPIGASLLEVAHANDIELEGACEASLACSTCHVYLDQRSFDKLDEATDDEADMLDLAFGLAEKYVLH